MTIAELLKSGHAGYFFVNPEGLNYQVSGGHVLEGAWVAKDTRVTLDETYRLEGWVLCVTKFQDGSSVYASLNQYNNKLRDVSFKVSG